MVQGNRSAVLELTRRVTAFAVGAACVMLVIAVLAGGYQIVSRFVIQEPAEWTEVVVRFALIWMVFLGIPIAFREGAMVSVDLLYRLARGRARRILDAIVSLAAVVLIAVMIWWGYDYAMRGRMQTIPGLDEYSMMWAYLAMPVGGVFSLFGVLGYWLEPRRHELETAQ